MRLVLLGPPGAGKGTQSRVLEEKLLVPKIASGDLLRAALRDRTATGLRAKSYMDAGNLVPDDVVFKLMAGRLEQPDARRGFILDGFPRSVPQAVALDKMLKQCKEPLDKVIAINVPAEEIVKRISGRRTCRRCGKMYHAIFDPPRNNSVCNECGGELYQREDDHEETVRTRLQVYATETAPLFEFYGKTGLLAEIDGLGHPEEILNRILSAIGKSRPTAATRK